MTPDQLRAIMDFLRQKVRLKDPWSGEAVSIGFDAPTIEQLVDAGLDPGACRQILDAPWWDEMVADIIETPRCAIQVIRPNRFSVTPRMLSRSTFASGWNSEAVPPPDRNPPGRSLVSQRSGRYSEMLGENA